MVLPRARWRRRVLRLCRVLLRDSILLLLRMVIILVRIIHTKSLPFIIFDEFRIAHRDIFFNVIDKTKPSRAGRFVGYC